MIKWKIYAKAILIPVITGGMIGLLIVNFMDYSALKKPPLAPPSILFPIVWTFLYILMGISYGIIKSKSQMTSQIRGTYYLQLFVNAIWSILFFVLKWRLLAFFWIILLIIGITIMIIQMYQKNKKAGLLQIPYLLWTLFASYLNLAIYIINK